MATLYNMKKYIIIIISAIALSFMLIMYYNYEESDSGWSIQCGVYQVTGLYCPGCGGQRAFHYLLHGEIGKSLRYNALFIVSIPFFLYLYYILVSVYLLKGKYNAKGFLFSKNFAIIFLLILFVYFILRNIPFSPFTYLIPY